MRFADHLVVPVSQPDPPVTPDEVFGSDKWAQFDLSSVAAQAQ